MANWTREHDAHIARECDGLKPIPEKGMPERLWKWNLTGRRTADGMSPICLPSYRTDANARDRAAEAWRKKVPGRSYESHSKVEDDWGVHEAWATCFSSAACIAGGGNGEDALLWALYRATGGNE